MKKLVIAGLIAFAGAGIANAQAAAQPAASAPSHYSTADSTVGDLLDNPQTKAVIDKYLPGFSTNPQIDMARGMTLKVVQPYAPDTVTDAALASIDADLEKIPVKK